MKHDSAQFDAPQRKRKNHRSKEAIRDAQYQFFRLVRYASGMQDESLLPELPDGSRPPREQAEEAFITYLIEVEAARRALLAEPPNPTLFHSCLERYGPPALAWLLIDPDVLVEMTRWWALPKWGDPTARDHLKRVLEPIGKILARGIPGRTGSLTPTVKDKEKEREDSNKRKQKFDALTRQAKVRLAGASNRELATALTSRSAPTRTAAKHVIRQRKKEDR